MRLPTPCALPGAEAREKDKAQMAIYHLSVKPVSRSSGRSATVSAAYRAAERIDDRRTGEIHAYTRKGGVESANIVLPDHAPTWASDRAALWNAAEIAEKRKDACVAREYEVALPSELPPEERRRLAVDFAKAMANREGCAVDVCIHAPGRGGDNRNHHAHLLRTTRKVEADGLGEKLDTEKAGRNRKEDLENVRAQWAELVNERLRQHGVNERIDHRSLEAQGIKRQPTQHLGPAVSGLVRRGADSDVARRMGEEANARLFAARETGRIERELAEAGKSILDLSGDLADAIRERDERQNEAERPKTERAGPAVQSTRFAAKPEEKQNALPDFCIKARRVAAAHGVKLGNPDIEFLPIEQQAKEFDRMQEQVIKARKDRLNRINDKATARLNRRTKLVESVNAQRPEMPRGLLAGFRMKAYDNAVSAWRTVEWDSQKLKASAVRLVGRLTEAAAPSAVLFWGERILRNAEHDLEWRVSRYRLDQKDKQEKEQKAGLAQRDKVRQVQTEPQRRGPKR